MAMVTITKKSKNKFFDKMQDSRVQSSEKLDIFLHQLQKATNRHLDDIISILQKNGVSVNENTSIREVTKAIFDNLHKKEVAHYAIGLIGYENENIASHEDGATTPAPTKQTFLEKYGDTISIVAKPFVEAGLNKIQQVASAPEKKRQEEEQKKQLELQAKQLELAKKQVEIKTQSITADSMSFMDKVKANQKNILIYGGIGIALIGAIVGGFILYKKYGK